MSEGFGDFVRQSAEVSALKLRQSGDLFKLNISLRLYRNFSLA
jgi:hypothetical protein